MHKNSDGYSKSKRVVSRFSVRKQLLELATLIVTNGTAAVDAITQVRPGDRFLPWDDVLHDGPVPSDLTLEHLSSIRARFIATNGWGRLEEIQSHFELRDHLLLGAREEFDEIVLWFEHDLYDQLQLIQVLYLLGTEPRNPNARATVSLICKDNFIGMSEPETLSIDFRDRERVTPDHYQTAIDVWTAFTHITPEKLLHLVHDGNLSALPYVRSALYRWFEEYPNTIDGLSRTERTVLDLVREGVTEPVSLFKAVQDREEAQFLGDASFWKILERMNSEPQEILATSGSDRFDSQNLKATSFQLTDLGERALNGSSGRVHTWHEKWMGGVLLGPRNYWYWDPQAESFNLEVFVR